MSKNIPKVKGSDDILESPSWCSLEIIRALILARYCIVRVCQEGGG